jgi:hypothetical protein
MSATRLTSFACEVKTTLSLKVFANSTRVPQDTALAKQMDIVRTFSLILGGVNHATTVF